MGLVLSASQITAYLMCARKYAYRYVERLPPESKASALAFGSAVHSALEFFHLERMEGKSPDPESVVKLFRADWDCETDSLKLSWKEDESAESLAETGAELVRLYVERFKNTAIEAAEVPFEIPLVDRETGEVIEDVRLRGYFDLLLPDQVAEIKTAARRFDQPTLRRKIQLTAYHYAYRELNGRDPALVVISLLKQKKPAIDVAGTHRTPGDDAWFVHLCASVAQAIESEAFPPNPGWTCGDCEYQKACGSWRGNSYESEITRAIFTPTLQPDYSDVG